jgi:murein L,D-transpeptidase YcbB/YkuD
MFLRSSAVLASVLVLASTVSAAPRWSKADIAALAEVAAAAPDEGLSNDYDAAALQALDAGTADARAEAVALTLAKDYFEGSPNIRGDRSWHIERGSLDYQTWLDEVLARHSVRASFRALLPASPAYAALKRAMLRCRAVAGDCTALAANLDRLRALPRNLGQRYLWVNVPAFRLDLIENGRPIASHRVIVGKPGSQTPSFQATVTGVTINPWWNVPCSIVEESIGKLIATRPAEAARRGYVASRDTKGRLVVRQKPGPDNALGQIKLEMPNPFDVYIHDTPSRELFAKPSRAFSHGCIRTEDPRNLALILLGQERANTVNLLLATGASKTLGLAEPMPVYIVYMTAEADPNAGDAIVTYRDIYGRDRR